MSCEDYHVVPTWPSYIGYVVQSVLNVSTIICYNLYEKKILSSILFRSESSVGPFIRVDFEIIILLL